MIGIITAKAPSIFKVTVTRKVHGNYIWDHFQCQETFVKKFLKEEMRWSLCCPTRPGKKTPEDVTQILTNAALRLVSTISQYNVPKPLLVNSDQTGARYSSGALETYAPTGSKQVEVVGKDEHRAFTLMVGISMSGEVLPFQAVYAGKTSGSLPTSSAPNYKKAVEELKFCFESSGNDTYWSTMKTMQSYVINILAPYFESHRKKLNLPNQLCVWQIDCWSVHRSLEFHSWMRKYYPWIWIHYIPANCTGLFQPCDVGIQCILKLALRRTALKDIVDDTMKQMKAGIEPSKVVFEKRLPVVRNRSVGWLVNGYEAINKCEIVEKVSCQLNKFQFPFLTIFIQAYKLCSTGEGGFNLSYECLTSERAGTALKDQIAASPEFAKSLQRPETIGEEEEEEVDEDDPMDEDVVLYDGVDSSRIIDEEVQALMLQEPRHLLMDLTNAESDHEDVQIVGIYRKVHWV